MTGTTNNGSTGRILVVDDTSANLQLLTSLLTEHGYTVHPASDGELALEFVRTTLPDLILLDIRMPGMDGYEVCRRLKADEKTCAVPVIFISALEDERDKVRGFREGAVDYISKPFQPEEVLARIRTHLRLRELTERLEQKVAERTAELQREMAERMRVEKRLALMAYALDHVHEAAFLIDEAGRFHYVNEQACRSLGCSRDQLLALNVADVDPDWPSDRWPEHWRTLRESASLTFEGRHRTGDGHLFPVEINANYFEYDGQAYNLALVRDITERKRMEADLENERLLLRTLFQTIPDPVWLKDENGVFLACNAAFALLYGVTEAELLGTTDYNFVEPELAAFFQQMDREAMNSGRSRTNEEWVPFADGHRELWETRKTPLYNTDGGVVGILGVARDITERRRLADELRTKEHYQRALLDNFPFMVWLKDTDSRLLAVNRPYLEAAGLPSDAPYFGKTDQDLFPLDLAEQYRADDREVMASGQKTVEEFVGTPGSLRWHETYKAPVLDSDGKLLGTVGFSRDITERKLMEDALRESERKYRTLTESLPDNIARYDRECRATYFNGMLAESVAIAKEWFLGRTPLEAHPEEEETAGAYERTIRRVLAGGAPDEVEMVVPHPDGGLRTHLVRIVAERDAEGAITGALAIGRDITERKRMEKALIAREREFRTLAENTPDVIVRYDRECRRIYVNPAFERVNRLSPQEVLGKTPLELSTELAPFAADFTLRLREVLKTGVATQIDLVLKKDVIDSSWFVRVIPEFDSNGEAVSALTIWTDITERKRMEEAIHSLNKTLESRLLALTQPVGDLANIQLDDLFNVDELQKIQDAFARATGVASLITDTQGRPITQPSNFCQLCEDVIRKTKQGLLNCRRSDTSLGRVHPHGAVLQRCLSGGLWDAGTSIRVGDHHIANWLIGQVLDESADEEALLAYADEIGADQEAFRHALNQVRRMPLHQFEKIADALYLIANQLSKLALQNLQQARFITEHKLMEGALRESEQKFRTLAENIPDLIVRYDRTLRRTYVNPAWEKASGLSAAQVVDVPAADIPQVPVPLVAEYAEKLRRVLTTGSPEEIEFSWVNARGESLFLEYAIVPEYNRHGAIVGVLAAGHDRTERKRAEELLYKREQEFRAIVENSPDTIVRYDRECRRIYVNPAFTRLVCKPSENMLGRPPVDGSPIADVAAYQNAIRHALETGEEMELEYTWQSRDGRTIVSLSRMVPEWGPDGKIASVLAIGRDITERRRHQMLEKARLRLFERLAQGGALPELLDQVVAYAETSCPDFIASIMLTSPDGQHLVSASAPGLPAEYTAAIDGIEIGEGIGSCGTAVWRGETVIAEDVRTHPFWAPYKSLALRAGFLSCWSEPVFDSSGEVLGTFGIYRREPGAPSDSDREMIRRSAQLAAIVIEHKRMEEQLRVSEQQFRTLAENSPNIIIRYDREGRRVYINPAFERETDIPAEAAVGMPLETQWRPSMPVEEYKATLRRVMATGFPAQLYIEWPRLDDGQMSRHSFHLVAERDPDGQVTGCLAIGHNITALKEAELRLSKLAATSPGALYSFLLRPDGTACMPYASPRIAELHGLRPEEIETDMTEAFARIHPDDRDRVLESIAASARTLSPWHTEFRLLHPRKGEVWVEGRSVPEHQPDGAILSHGFLHDITERKQVEESLRVKREQLAAMAVELSLAEERERRRIASELHDHIGQTLLLGRIKLGTLAGAFESESDQETYEEIRSLLERTIRDVRSLTQQLHPPVLASVGLEAALEWLARRMEADYSLRVEFLDDLSPKPLTEELAAVVYQSARELLINVAKHAETGKARLTLGREADMFLLTVRDQGAGFTCVSGLCTTMESDCSFGLFNIRQRIKLLGGEVTIESAPGQGTCATIRVPLAMG